MISILYVDDEKTLLDITKIYMEKTGEFDVDISLSAKDAIDRLSQRSYDAVVSDFQMPGMDGLEFLKYLRPKYATLPFILFTGKGREEVAIEALNSGADFYLQKGGEPKSQFAELRNKILQAVNRRRAEKALRESEEKYRVIVDNAPIGIFHSTPEGNLVDVNPVYAGMFGYDSPGEMIAEVNRVGMATTLYTSPEQREAIIRDALEDTGWHTYDTQYRKKDGTLFFCHLSFRAYINPASGNKEFEGFVVDITESRTAQVRIAAGERRYHNIFDAAGDAMLVLDFDSGSVLDANPAAVRMFGYTVDELRLLHHKDLFADPEAADCPDTCQTLHLPQFPYRKKDGTIFFAETTSTHYPQKTRTICIVSIRDITERKKAEERVSAAQRLYIVLSQINQSIVRVRDLETLLADICRISVEYGKFRMVWVALFDNESKSIRPVAHAGSEDGYLSAIEIHFGDDALGSSPMGRVIDLGTYDICNDIETDPRMEPWRAEALKRGYRSSAAFPIRLHGTVVGAISIYAEEPSFFNETEVNLLDEIAMDVSFALDMLDEQARRTRAETALTGSEERVKFFADVLEHASQPFAVGYPDGRIGIVNPAFCELLGYTEAGLHDLTWHAITPPEFHEQEAEAIRELERTGIPQRYEKEYRHKDGTRVPVEMFAHRVVDSAGNTRYFYSFVTDISERRQAEEAIRAERDLAHRYLDIAGVMLCVINREGTVTLINRKGAEILGYAEEEILGKDWCDTFVPDGARPEVKEVFDRIMSGEVAPFEYHENTVLAKSGERTIAFHNTLLTGPSGEISGILFSGEDITPRREMEAALRESEERFRNLIQNASDMIRIIDKNGLIVYSSPSTRRITGYDPAGVIGRRPTDFMHPDDRERVKAALGEVVDRTNPGIPTEFRIRHADGHYVDVESVALNLLDIPSVNGIVTTTRPIAERRKAEQALRESEERYRTIFEAAGDAILLMNEVFLDGNQKLQELLGYRLDEIVGLQPEDFSPPLQPDGRSSHEAVSAYASSALGGAPQSFSWVFRRKDGSPIETEISLRAVTVAKEPCLIALIRDVTGLNRATLETRKLSSFAALNPDPVIEFNAQKEITWANPAATLILGNLGMPDNPAAFLPEDTDAVLLSLDAATPPRRLYREVTVGDNLFAETITVAEESGRIRIYAHDITNRVRITSAFEQANRKLNLLTSITRHDIKNKLTGVLGYLELSLGSTQDKTLLEYLKRAETSANAIRQQIDFTKEYENLGVKSATWQEITPLINEVTTQLSPGSVQIVDETEGLSIWADPMLVKIVYNLMENSLKHGEHVSRIRFGVRAGPESVTLLYEDDGVGIPAGDKEKIFNRTPRTDAGIGLFLVREILSITGITILETGEPGSGARYEISIPRGKFQMKRKK
jgi:PAS domain S-box-containing protein